MACFLLLSIAVVVPAKAFSQSSPPNSLNRQEVVQFLKETVDWYHARAVERTDSNKSRAARVLRLRVLAVALISITYSSLSGP